MELGNNYREWRSELEGDNGKEKKKRKPGEKKKGKGKKGKEEKNEEGGKKCTTPGFEPATFNSTGTAYRLKVESHVPCIHRRFPF